MASFHGLWSLAGFTGGLISAWMVAENIPPFWHFVCVNAITITILLVARNFVVSRDARPEGVKTAAKRKFVKPDSFIITLGLIAFASMICEGTMFDWSGIYFKKVVGAPRELTRIGYIAFMSTMAGGRFVSDAFVTRFGATRVLQFSGITILSGMLLSVAFPTIIIASIGFLLVGIGVSSVVPLAYSMAGRSKNIPPGIALASVSSIGFFGFLLGPPIIGFIAEASSLRTSFMCIAFLGLGTTLLAKRLRNINK